MTDFGHVRKSRCDLTSTVLVEELLDANRDVFAIGVQDATEADYAFFVHGRGTPDERRVLWSLCSHVDDLRKESKTDPGCHCGDCTSHPMSCARCLAESVYEQGEEMLATWIKLKVELGLPACTTKESCVELLSVLLGTEYRCRDFFELSKQSWKCDDPVEKKRLEDEAAKIGWTTDVAERYKQWLILSHEDQDKAKIRAVQFRGYFDNRPVVEGIPWW